MSLLVQAHPGCFGQNPESSKTAVCKFGHIYTDLTFLESAANVQ